MRKRDLLDLFFDRSCRPAPLSLPHLDDLLVVALRIYREVPDLDLTPAEKQALGGYLFGDGPMLVHQVAQGLLQYRASFPEIHADPAQMEHDLLRASRWLSLRDFGLSLARIADDHYAAEMGGLVKVALSIVRHVRADRQRLFTGPTEAQRAAAMAGAEDTLSPSRKRTGRKVRSGTDSNPRSDKTKKK